MTRPPRLAPRTPGQVLSIGVGALLAAGLVGWGGVQVVGLTTAEVHRTDHLVFPNPPHQLRIDTSNGDVAVVRGGTAEVTVDRRTTSSLTEPAVSATTTGGALRLTSHCPPVAGMSRCGTSYVVHIPAGVSVDARTSSGDASVSGVDGTVSLHSSSGTVSATDVTGRITLDTSSGDVTATRVSGGPVSLHASSGSISADGVRAAELSAATSSGDVGVHFVMAPSGVTATSASGDVEVTVPHGPELYAIAQQTGSGDHVAAVRSDPSSTRRIRERTSSGDVSLTYR